MQNTQLQPNPNISTEQISKIQFNSQIKSIQCRQNDIGNAQFQYNDNQSSTMEQKIVKSIIQQCLTQIIRMILLLKQVNEFALITTFGVLTNDHFIFTNTPPCSLSPNQFVLDFEPKSYLFQEGIIGHVKQKIQSRCVKKQSQKPLESKEIISKNWKKIENIYIFSKSKKNISQQKVSSSSTSKKVSSHIKHKQVQQKDKNAKNIQLVSLQIQEDQTQDRFVKYLRYIKGENSKFTSLNSSFQQQNNVYTVSQLNKQKLNKKQSSSSRKLSKLLRPNKQKKTIILGNISANKNNEQQSKQIKKLHKNKTLILPYQSCFSVNEGNLQMNNFSFNIDQLKQNKQKNLNSKLPNINIKILKQKQKSVQRKKQFYQMTKSLPVVQNKQDLKLPAIIIKRNFRQQQLSNQLQIWRMNKNCSQQQQIQLLKFYQSRLRKSTVTFKTSKKKKNLQGELQNTDNFINKAIKNQVKLAKEGKRQQLKKQKLMFKEKKFI